MKSEMRLTLPLARVRRSVLSVGLVQGRGGRGKVRLHMSDTAVVT